MLAAGANAPEQNPDYRVRVHRLDSRFCSRYDGYMTKSETAWVAGILEGEACFDYNKSNPRYPRVRIEMADMDVITRLHEVIGAGRVSYPKPRKAWSHTALLTINGRENVEPLLRAVLPWMGARRSAKIAELLAAYDA